MGGRDQRPEASDGWADGPSPFLRLCAGNSAIPCEIAHTEMSAVYIALPVALLLALVGVLAFIWSVRTGQLDDLTTPGVRVLLDDDEVDRNAAVRQEKSTEDDGVDSAKTQR